MADTVDCAGRMAANRETVMTYLPHSLIHERFQSTGSFAQAANLPPYDPLRL
jgi:hypothetical protein